MTIADEEQSPTDPASPVLPPTRAVDLTALIEELTGGSAPERSGS